MEQHSNCINAKFMKSGFGEIENTCPSDWNRPSRERQEGKFSMVLNFLQKREFLNISGKTQTPESVHWHTKCSRSGLSDTRNGEFASRRVHWRRRQNCLHLPPFEPSLENAPPGKASGRLGEALSKKTLGVGIASLLIQLPPVAKATPPAGLGGTRGGYCCMGILTKSRAKIFKK